MKEIKFPLLKPYQIEVRVGQVTKNGCTLLLYKTSRTDAEILDEIVGMGNWQKRFYTLQGVGIGERERSIVVCSVGIYDDDKKEWIWKDDSGTESQVEQDKGICSDAFKRASGGSCWGIGRELYYSGFIFVKCPTTKNEKTGRYELDDKFVTYEVKDIKWSEKPLTLKTLVITDNKGNVVYSYGSTEKVSKTSQNEPKNTIQQPTSTRAEDKKVIDSYINTLSMETYEKFKKYLLSRFNKADISDLNDEEYHKLAMSISKEVK